MHLDGGDGPDGGDTVTPSGGEPDHPALAAALAAVTRDGTDTGSHAVAATAAHLARTPAGSAGGASAFPAAVVVGALAFSDVVLGGAGGLTAGVAAATAFCCVF